MSRKTSLAAVVVMAIAVLPSTASAASNSDAAKACVASTAPGKARGTCVAAAARNLVTGGFQASFANFGPNGETYFWLDGTGLKPETYYIYATYDAVTGEQVYSPMQSWADAAGEMHTWAGGPDNCASGRRLNIIVDEDGSAIFGADQRPDYTVPVTCP